MTSTQFYRTTTIISIIIILFLVNCQGEKDVIKVPVRIEVPIPAIEGRTDTIYVPKPILVEVPKETDTHLKAYLATKDSLERLRLYLDAITVREYRNEFEDDTIRIDTWSRVRGELLAQSNEYFIKPRTITFDTVIDVQIPQFNELFLYGGGKYSFIDKSMGFELKLILKNKKNNLLSIGIDSDGMVSGGYGFKIN
jgi:hypothetical protein